MVLDLPSSSKEASWSEASEIAGNRDISEVSYAHQFEELFSKELKTSVPVAKPSNAAQARVPGSRRVLFSDVFATLMRSPFSKDRRWVSTDYGRLAFFTTMHAFGAAALCFCSWRNLISGFLLYVMTGVGITYSYHRQLAHRSFKSPKWLEYLAAYCGAMAMQGGPIEWVSDHRYHHLHTETPLDPHSSYEGFYWSHLGWMLDEEIYKARCSDRRNVGDLMKQPFYRHMQKHYLWHSLGHFALCYAVGGLPLLCWRALGVSLLYHVTWFVNSAAHLWGKQTYATGDQSRNNWWVGFLAFGEGWHNNHHAFEYSAQHGLGKRQFDLTWEIIKMFKRVGLVSSVKLPTEAAKHRLALEPAA